MRFEYSFNYVHHANQQMANTKTEVSQCGFRNIFVKQNINPNGV